MNNSTFRHQFNHESPDQFNGSCRNKRRHTSKRQASGVLRVMKTKADIGPRLHVYKCPVCRGWHLGN